MGELTPKQLETRYRDWPPRSWYATRRNRRLLAGAGAGSAGLIWVSAIVCWYLAPSDLAMWTTFALGGSALVIYIVVYSALVGATRGVVGLAERYLDERQSLERQKAQADARRGTTAVLIALGAMLSFAVSGAEMTIRIPSAAIVMLMYAVVTTHLILPSLLMGWRMPDPPPDDEDDRDDGDDSDDEGHDRIGEVSGRTGNGQPIDGNTAT
ncbi:hypothetical protein FHR32_000601 [Streptosporangium album]|uniref:Uncharacterized protein n=1 Tax=Streptosporangium album TaxID=47479 RepID=A0A7W7RRK9_9ACTN|nr:hypothetical protein [Streptosporangium album]MBB4936296.1 hypothetical protein [Streptosporangium album]